MGAEGRALLLHGGGHPESAHGHARGPPPEAVPGVAFGGPEAGALAFGRSGDLGRGRGFSGRNGHPVVVATNCGYGIWDRCNGQV